MQTPEEILNGPKDRLRAREISAHFEALRADLISLIDELEGHVPSIACTHVGDAVVTQRLSDAGSLRRILKSHGLEAPAMSSELREAILARGQRPSSR